MTTKIIAHRGASKFAPENTMPAFQLAYEMNAEGIETDVQLTKDNVPVLIHDEHVKRTTNGVGYIKDLKYEQLKQLDAGSWFHHNYVGTTIVSLEEFLKWAISKPLYLNIELKNNKIEYRHIESIVYEMLQHYQLLNRTTISTFNPNSVKRMKNLFDDVETAFLTSKRDKNLVEYASKIGANAIHIKYRLLNPLLVKMSHKKKMPVRVYTVNRIRQMMYCYQQNCDGIITDIPNKAITARELHLAENT
ncbi:glycerophosphodiester phosphodiesterase [Ornithinibacillus halophilus]|uniref:Glycerophosphoryl diester phosphodiesterase n=1 Tax=Ornithinibacillus halophilus TaxID=930117 RepID=A0A1M5CVN3_9BACI|nr:glycerophosphodiester phosphodiesterase [Ornithinibacillus halophilus]SHF58753.1 glycerophosphoryl diester phosphodiesterase [Ornithinibacillus halophilus]